MMRSICFVIKLVEKTQHDVGTLEVLTGHTVLLYYRPTTAGSKTMNSFPSFQKNEKLEIHECMSLIHHRCDKISKRSP